MFTQNTQLDVLCQISSNVGGDTHIQSSVWLSGFQDLQGARGKLAVPESSTRNKNSNKTKLWIWQLRDDHSVTASKAHTHSTLIYCHLQWKLQAGQKHDSSFYKVNNSLRVWREVSSSRQHQPRANPVKTRKYWDRDKTKTFGVWDILRLELDDENQRKIQQNKKWWVSFLKFKFASPPNSN